MKSLQSTLQPSSTGQTRHLRDLYLYHDRHSCRWVQAAMWPSVLCYSQLRRPTSLSPMLYHSSPACSCKWSSCWAKCLWTDWAWKSSTIHQCMKLPSSRTQPPDGKWETFCRWDREKPKQFPPASIVLPQQSLWLFAQTLICCLQPATWVLIKHLSIYILNVWCAEIFLLCAHDLVKSLLQVRSLWLLQTHSLGSGLF